MRGEAGKRGQVASELPAPGEVEQLERGEFTPTPQGSWFRE